jgi:serine/threonine protein kinase
MSSASTTLKLRPFKAMAFGQYTLLRHIAVGGMGEVFLARSGEGNTPQLCVIKKILPEFANDARFVKRFLAESNVLKRLRHPAIAQVVDAGEVDGAPFLALEFVDGRDLRRVLDRRTAAGRRCSAGFAVHVGLGVLEALTYAFAQSDEAGEPLQLVHRDISPSNILVSFEGLVKVIDFGLAKSTMSNHGTNPGFRVGKLRYMAPEQARLEKADARSDIYALGLTLYEMLSGQHPLDGSPRGHLLQIVAQPQFKALHEVAPTVPKGLCDVVMKALAVDANERFVSANAMADALGEYATLPLAEAAQLVQNTFGAEYEQERKVLRGLLTLPKPSEPVAVPSTLPELKTEPTAPHHHEGQHFSPAPAPRFSPAASTGVSALASQPLAVEPNTETQVPTLSAPRHGHAAGVVVGSSAMVREVTPTKSPARKTVGLAWLVLPALLLGAGAAYWQIDKHFEQQRRMQLEKEEREAQAQKAELDAQAEARSRELKVPTAPVVEADVALPTLAKLPKPKAGGKTLTAARLPSGTPGQQAVKALTVDFEKLDRNNEALVKSKYRLRMLRLKSKFPQVDEDGAVLDEVRALHGEIKAELQKPENQ